MNQMIPTTKQNHLPAFLNVEQSFSLCLQIATSNPLVSARQELSVLQREYAQDDSIYQLKIKVGPAAESDGHHNVSTTQSQLLVVNADRPLFLFPP